MRNGASAMLFTALLLGACQSSALPPGAPDDSSEGDSDGDRRVGGSTGDFGGRCRCTETTRELGLSEVDEVLGFSAGELLDRLEGEYALAMVWGDACSEESPTAAGCTDPAPEFTGSETEVQIAVERAGTTARVEDCVSDPPAECRVTWLVVPVAGTLATTDGLLDETFEAELRARSRDELQFGEPWLLPAALGGALPSRMPQLDRLSWSFGLTETDAWFEVLAVVQGPGGSRSRARAEPPEGGRPREGHSWGVAAELDRARQ